MATYRTHPHGLPRISTKLMLAIFRKGIPVVEGIDNRVIEAFNTQGKRTVRFGTDSGGGIFNSVAGWAIHLAGDAGAALEQKIGSPLAAVLIYGRSRPHKRTPNFYTRDEEAIELLKEGN